MKKNKKKLEPGQIVTVETKDNNRVQYVVEKSRRTKLVLVPVVPARIGG